MALHSRILYQYRQFNCIRSDLFKFLGRCPNPCLGIATTPPLSIRHLRVVTQC